MRDAAINLRALPEQRDLIDHAASLLGKNRSDFMLEAACDRAQAVVLDQVFFSLDADKFKQFTAQIGHLKKMIEAEKNLIKMSTNVFENFDFYTGKAQYLDVLVKVTGDDGSQSDYTFVLTKYDLSMEGKPLPGVEALKR